MLLRRVRVTFLTCLVCTLLASGLTLAALPAPRGELRIVDHSPLNWVTVTLNVFEHLMEFDRDGRVVSLWTGPWYGPPSIPDCGNSATGLCAQRIVIGNRPSSVRWSGTYRRTPTTSFCTNLLA